MTLTRTGPSTGPIPRTDDHQPAPAARPSSSGRSRRANAPRMHDKSGYVFVAPFLIAALVFLVWPIINGLWMSLTDNSLTNISTNVVGLANYAEALTDPMVWQTLGQTVLFTIMSTVPLVLVGLVMALLVHTGLGGQWLWRLSFFAPYLLPVAVVTNVFIWILAPELGLANRILDLVGIAPVSWLSQPGVALASIALVTTWWTVGFNFLLYLAALQGIPTSLYEAATLDGAGSWRKLFSITLPQLRPVTGVIVVLQLLASMKVFDQIYLMTHGGPNNTTRSILEYIYDTGFTGYRLGYASAISYVFFALIIIVSVVKLLPGRNGKAN